MIFDDILRCFFWAGLNFFCHFLLVWQIGTYLKTIYFRRRQRSILLQGCSDYYFERDLTRWELIFETPFLSLFTITFFYWCNCGFDRYGIFLVSLLDGVCIKSKFYTMYGVLSIYTFCFSWKIITMIKKMYLQALNEKERKWTVFSLVLVTLLYLHVSYWLLS